jgi:hypothetical protein
MTRVAITGPIDDMHAFAGNNRGSAPAESVLKKSILARSMADQIDQGKIRASYVITLFCIPIGDTTNG